MENVSPNGLAADENKSSEKCEATEAFSNDPEDDEATNDDVLNPDVKEETMTEVEIASSNTDTSGSSYVRIYIVSLFF